MRLSTIALAGLVVGLALAICIAAEAPSRDVSSGLHGSQRRGASHLRLIWSSAPPSILDVDTGRLQRLSSVVAGAGSTLWLTPVPDGALAAVGAPRSVRAVLIHADGSAHFVASASSVVGAWNAPAAWALDRLPGGGCAVRLVPGDRPAVPAPCGFLETDGAAGLVVITKGGELLLDHRTGRVRAHVRGAESVVAPLRGESILEIVTTPTDGTHRMSLVDVATGRRRALPWPSQLGEIDGVVAQPNGPLVAVGFASPGSSPQGEDIFVLDIRDGLFTHVPGYPILEDLKRSSVAWTSDGRLVLTIGLGHAMTLGVYRPGDREVSRRRIHVPPFAGSDTFVPVVSRA